MIERQDRPRAGDCLEGSTAMIRERLIVFGIMALLMLAILALSVPFFAEIDMLGSAKQVDYVTITATQPLDAWISFSAVSSGVGSTSTTVAAKHPEACRVWAMLPGSGVATGDLRAAFCRSLRPAQRHIAIYQRGWITGRLTITDLIQVRLEGK